MYGFGERLKRLRTERGLTQKQLGERIGVRNSIVSFYEVGDRQPSLDIKTIVIKVFIKFTNDRMISAEGVTYIEGRVLHGIFGSKLGT